MVYMVLILPQFRGQIKLVASFGLLYLAELSMLIALDVQDKTLKRAFILCF